LESGARIPGWQALSKAPAISSATCFLRAFRFGVHHGINLVFGRNGGKRLLFIAARLSQISVITVSSCSLVVALFTRSVHCCPFCWIPY
jgi:hypothetical protein